MSETRGPGPFLSPRGDPQLAFFQLWGGADRAGNEESRTRYIDSLLWGGPFKPDVCSFLRFPQFQFFVFFTGKLVQGLSQNPCSTP